MQASEKISAKPLLDCRQTKFMQRLMAGLKGHQGLEEILDRRGSELTKRLRQYFFLKPEKERSSGEPRLFSSRLPGRR